MKIKNLLLISLCILLNIAMISCTKNIIIEPENPDNPEEVDPKPTNPEKTTEELLFNTTWKQTKVTYESIMNPECSEPTVNENAIIEFTDIRYKDTGKYIIRQNSEPIGLYFLNSDEYNDYINFDWYTLGIENGWKYGFIYGYGQFEIRFSGDSRMNYSTINSGLSTYYYTKISPE